ncbi:unnamed protein product [Phytomonas sp. EM1]|nr:unnamed protein product [Phytomonas sp. EM1]|eukprot:CCW62035.1 unnamed protein product [Phytomonas sp. isolate EM1]
MRNLYNDFFLLLIVNINKINIYLFIGLWRIDYLSICSNPQATIFFLSLSCFLGLATNTLTVNFFLHIEMRKSSRFYQSYFPEMHRYANSTFHEGTHRQSPGDSTPWRDTSSPINRLRAWWLAPMAKASVIAAWCITLAFGTYCFSIQEDAKGTYLLNNVLLRSLHDEIQRADANQQRTLELEETIKQYLEEKHDKKKSSQSNQSKASSEEVAKGLINYELQLSREKYRGDRIHERNQHLVEEISKLRQEISKSNEENKLLLQEIGRLKKFIERVNQ